MESEESAQVLGMSVFDPSCGFPNQRPSLHAPTIAEFAVFGGWGIEVRIEAAAGEVAVAAHGDVVACKKIRIFRVAVEVLVNQCDDELARLGEDIAFQAVES